MIASQLFVSENKSGTMRDAFFRAIGRFRDLPLQTKGLAVVAIPLAGLMLVVFAFYMALRDNEAAERAVTHSLEVRAQIEEVHSRVQECETAVMGYLLTGDPAWLVPYRENRGLLPGVFAALEGMVRDNPSELARVQHITGLVMKRTDFLDSLLAQTPPLTGWHPALSESSASVEKINLELGKLKQDEDRILEQRWAHAREVNRHGYYVIAGGALIVPAAAIAAMFLFAAAIARRVQVLQENAQRLAQGRAIAPMRSGKDELGRLEQSLGAAAGLLADRERALRDSAAQLEERVQLRTAELAAEVAVRARAEEDLADTNQRLQAIIDASPLAIMRIDLEGKVQGWNHAAEEMSGFKAEDVLGRPLPSGPDAAPALSEERLAAIARGEALNGVEIERRRKDGSTLHMRVWTAPLRNAAGEIRGEIAVAADFTEHRRLQEQFIQAQKMEAVGRLAGGAAHDFNNVITVISGYGQILLDAVADIPPLKDAAQEVLKASERAAALASQLLAFSRRQVIQPQVLNINEVISNLQRMLGRLIGEDIELKTILSPDLGLIRADPGQLEQVIINLALNSRDAMPEGGCLTIETANVKLEEAPARSHALPPGLYTVMAVSDTGCGMTAEVQSHMFEPFYTTKERGKGTGLGLSTVYGIVKQHGGEIYVYSEPGKGSTFKIYFPQAGEAASPAAAEAASVPLPRGSETVLVVEDEEGVRKLVRSVLELSGYHVLEADSGEAAMEVSAAHEGEIELLVTDVVMPKMSGRDLAEALVLLRPNIKVLFLSGYADRAIIEHGILETGAAFMQKPFTPQALTRKVRDVLDNHA
jgi:PAS domain S-box-containing protein